MTLTVVILYMSALLALGLFSNRLFRGTSEDYMLASHSIGPFFLLMSLFGTTMTSFALVGSTGESYVSGVGVYGKLASASGIMHSLCFFLIGLPLWRLGNRMGFTTQVEFFRARLDNRGIGLLLFPVLVGLTIPYLLIGILGGGSVVSAIGVPPWAGSLIICIVVLIYVFFGGMRGTAWANCLQTLIFMVLGLVTFFVIAKGIGGKDSLLASMQAASQAVDEKKMTREGMSYLKYASYLLIPLSVGMFPHVFQHWLTAKNANSFKLPIVMHPIFILIVWMPCVMIGVWATAWPAEFGDPPAKPNTVLATLVTATSGDLLAGLLTAGILAAIMSSLDSQFLCLGTMFTKDIAIEYGGQDRWKDKEQVVIARCFVVAVVAVTYIISLFSGASVFPLGIWCFSGFTGLFPLVIAAIYWRRLTAAGAYACIITTALVWTWLFIQADYAQNRAYNFPNGSQLLPVVTITACSAIAMLVVSLMTQPPRDKVLDQFFPPKK